MSSGLPYFVPTRFVWRFGGTQVCSSKLMMLASIFGKVCSEGGVQVQLCGSFTRWVETVPMIPVDQNPGMFAVLVHLPPGCVSSHSAYVRALGAKTCTLFATRPSHRVPATLVIACVQAFPSIAAHRNLLDTRFLMCRYHQYKFIVDGEWRHDDTMPFMPDPLGNVNNWLYVRQPDAAGYEL